MSKTLGFVDATTESKNNSFDGEVIKISYEDGLRYNGVQKVCRLTTLDNHKIELSGTLLKNLVNWALQKENIF